MNRNERIDSLEVAVASAVKGVVPGIWTALPGILQSFDAASMTCSAQPAIQVRVFAKDGGSKVQSLPLCVDVPVQILGGGGYSVTFPMNKGDEGLLVFACRCIDSWWQSGGVQPQAEVRMHDLSDGFFIPGFRSQSRKLANISTTKPQFRSDDGTVIVELDKTAGKVNVTAAGGLWINGVMVNVP